MADEAPKSSCVGREGHATQVCRSRALLPGFFLTRRRSRIKNYNREILRIDGPAYGRGEPIRGWGCAALLKAPSQVRQRRTIHFDPQEEDTKR